jgi:hypothetical protein
LIGSQTTSSTTGSGSHVRRFQASSAQTFSHRLIATSAKPITS